MARKRVVVCGATGFIGRNITETFAGRGDLEVVGVCHSRRPYSCPGLQWIKADLTSAADIDRVVRGADVVVQAAATTSGAKDIVTRPHIHVTDNAVMNSLLLRAAFDHRVAHFVFFSCTVMYHSSESPLREEDFDANRDPYPNYFASGWTKVYVEKMCEFFSRVSDTRFTVIRHSNIYGPHDKFDLDRSHVFGATVTKVMTAKNGKIKVWGTGEEGRDLLYVSDLVDFVTLALDKQEAPFGLYNVGTGRATKIKDLVQKIVKASGRNLTIQQDLSQPTIKATICVDCTKAHKQLGWIPKVILDDGISRTIDWWRVNFATEGK